MRAKRTYTTSQTGKAVSENEEGFALLLTVFIITVASILIVEYADTVHSFQRSSRTFTDQVRGVFMLKSAVNIGKMLIEAPKPPGREGQDSLSDPWAMIGSAPTIPIEGFPGDLRLEIIDEDGKIDLNGLQTNVSAFQNLNQGGVNGATPTGAQQTGAGQPDPNAFYRDSLRDLFYLLGFLNQKYDPSQFRTIGNTAFEAPDQVATIADWIDRDSENYHPAGFDGQGFESGADKTWFFNRPLRSLSELALVPGMTLERIGMIVRFVRVSQALPGSAAKTVNINTAPLEVLLAMGMPQTLAEDIVQQRLAFPYTQDTISGMVQADPKLSGHLAVRSNEFQVLSRVMLSTRTLWARAYFSVQHQGMNNKATLRLMEFY